MRRFARPQVQLLGATCVMVGGAWLIALWAVGVVLIFSGVVWVLFIDWPEPKRVNSRHEEVLERWRRAS